MIFLFYALRAQDLLFRLNTLLWLCLIRNHTKAANQKTVGLKGGWTYGRLWTQGMTNEWIVNDAKLIYFYIRA